MSLKKGTHRDALANASVTSWVGGGGVHDETSNLITQFMTSQDCRNDSTGPADIKRDTVAPRYIHESGSAAEQMSAEIYCDCVDTQRDNRQNNILCVIPQHKHVRAVNPQIERL